MKLDDLWYGGHWLAWPLVPLSGLFRLAVSLRRLAFRRGWLESHKLPVPVIVVGNLTLGGTGKTPLVIWLAGFLCHLGWRPGILTRGYGGRSRHWPRPVTADTDPRQVGDEAVLLARHAGCPVVAGPDRVAAGWSLLQKGACDILVCDDGLQHYRLARDVEILLIDASRGFGNGFCLPAGPLREPVARGAGIPLKLCSGGTWPDAQPLSLRAGDLINLRDPALTLPLASLRGRRVTAVAGIGNPARFFSLLRQTGLYLDEHPYPDHHDFSAADVASWPPGPVVMTEKDAVKCLGFAGQDHWYLPVTVVPGALFEQQLSLALKGLSNG